MNPPAPNPPAAPENILVRGVNWLGDAVMSAPALQRLREAQPAARITLLAPEKLAGLWDGQPFLDELLLFSPSDTLCQTARRLRAKKFSAALAFPNSLRSALELWLAGIPRRAGYAGPWRSLFLTIPVPPRSGALPMRKRPAAQVRQLAARGGASAAIPPGAHHTLNYLCLVAALGASSAPLPPRLTLSQEAAEKTAAHLGMAPLPEDRPWFGLNPGAQYGPAKRWPADRFIAAALDLQKQTRCRWVIFGGGGDCQLAAGIAAALQPSPSGPPSVLNLAGKTTLRELMAALKICRLLLTNDTGPMHIAAALGTPVVVLFGSTSPEMTRPPISTRAHILRASDVPCSPCFLRKCPIDFRCMTRISPAAVVQAALLVLRDT
jgi:heptosyltransferase-2